MQKYTKENEQEMKKFYDTLNEKQRRQYLAVEVKKLGFCGQKYLCEILNCDAKTVRKAVKQQQSGLFEDKTDIRIRKSGAGRKSNISKDPIIEKMFLEVIEIYTAGDPMETKIKWTNLGPTRIAELMTEKGVNVTPHVAKQLLTKNGYKQRKLAKVTTIESVENRDEQFKNIEQITKEYNVNGNPVISVDVKKKSK